MIVTLNAKQFTDWIVSLPPKTRMKQFKADPAMAVARRLAQLAGSQPDPEPVQRVARQLARLALEIAPGKMATNSECASFLSDFASYLPGDDLNATLAAISSAPEAHLPYRPVGPAVEYRMEEQMLFVPAVAYHARTRRKWPPDDVSERIAVALDAMNSAQCKRPATYVAEALKKSGRLPEAYCTVEHVRSRSKAFPGLTPLLEQEYSTWLHCYWETLHPESANKGVGDPEWPERFLFEKCDC